MEARGNKNIARVTVHSVSDRPGEAGKLFDTLGMHNINIELISYSPAEEGTTNISFAVTEDALENVVNSLRKRYPGKVSYDREVAMLSVYSENLVARPGIAGRIFSILGDNDINIELISTSINSISMVIKEKWLERAMELLKNI